MNIVVRQSFKYSLIGYLGFILGTFSALFIFPYNLEFYGKLRYILPTAELLVPVVVLGISYSNVKFFYNNQQANNQQNFLWLSLLAISLNFLIFLVLFFVLAEIFSPIKESKLWQMKTLIFSIVLVLSLSQTLNKYISNFKRIVIPNVFENIFPKLANLTAFCLFVFIGFSEKLSYWIFFIFFILALISYFFYVNRLEALKPKIETQFLKTKNYWKQIINYSLFIFMGNIGNFIATRIDNYMIGEYIGYEQNGIYSTFLSIIGLLTIPQMGLYNISAPIINKTLEEERFSDLNIFHKKTALNLFFIGLTLFACILVGFPHLTSYIKNGEQLLPYQNVLFILGFSLLFDLATGFNGSIISMSKYYRFNIIVMLFLASNTILLNYYFINYTTLGIVGVAIATSIALTLFNLVKIIFNYKKFGVLPLSIKMIYASAFAIIGYLFASSLPNFSIEFLNLIYKPTLIVVVMFFANYYLAIVPLNSFLNKEFFKRLVKF